MPRIPFHRQLDLSIGLTTPFHMRQSFIRHQFDLIHTHTEFSAGWSAKWAARWLGLPLVHTLHTFYEHFRHYVPFGQCVPRPIVRQRQAAYLRGYDAVICPSRKAYDLFSPYTDNLTLIPNALAPFSVPHRREPKHLLYVGRLSREKRSRLLVQTLLPLLREGYQLTLVGDGEDRTELTRLTKGMAVSFTGWVEWEALPAYYGRASAFVTASLSENHPMTLLEALHSGLPIVAYDDISLHEMVREGYNGHLVTTQQAFRAAVRALQPRHGEHSHQIAQNFAFKQTIEQTEHLYMRLQHAYQTSFSPAPTH